MWSEAGFFGIYKGFLSTMARDVPAWAAYFWTYEFLKEKYVSNSATDKSYANCLKLMVIGSLAGQASWISSYPFD